MLFCFICPSVQWIFPQVDIHDKFILNCTNQIRQSADLFSNESTENIPIEEKCSIPREMLQQEAKKTVRCLTVLKEYVAECDDEHAEERAILPHGRYVLFLMHLFYMDLLQMNMTNWIYHLYSVGHVVVDMCHWLSDSHLMVAREMNLKFGHIQMSQ